MAADQATARSISFAEAIRVENVDPHTYRVNLDETFCIGSVPNGGYTAACILAVASKHLSARNQPDTVTAHLEYPRRTAAGPAIVQVDEVKLGAQLSTLHLTLWQGGLVPHAPWTTPGVSRRIVLAYAIQANLRDAGISSGNALAAGVGFSIPTGFETTPAAALPRPLPDWAALRTTGTDGRWELFEFPEAARAIARSNQKWRFYLPRHGPLTPGVLDMWTCLASGEPITQSALVYVADSFPYNLHEFLAAPELRELLQAVRQGDSAGDTTQGKAVKARIASRSSMWFPTVALNLDVKKTLLEEGVEWLAVRVTSKQVKDGRYDLDISIRDAEGELVALSHQIAMILTMERNMSKSRAAL